MIRLPKMQNSFIPENVYMPYFEYFAILVGVEIGVGSACGSVALLDRFPRLKLYCIDPWKHIDNAPFEAGHPQEEHDIGYTHSKKRLEPYGERAIIIKKTSDEALIDIPDNLDFVHIDGHHEYNQVVKDIKNYYPKIKDGGIISGHDYKQVPDVTWAVDEFFKGQIVNNGDDFTWWVYKNV